ncbi:MAG: bifunctional DNA primase/polymerase [Actinobacteria bacterium]|nr:bifunctional DNA primase/polymerase [Actinomycetota bacterium]
MARALAEGHPRLSAMTTTRAPRRSRTGPHRWVRRPSGLSSGCSTLTTTPGMRISNAAGRLPGVADAVPGIDLRGDGRYVVAPPSIHASGRRYRWDRRPIAAVPAWMCPEPSEPFEKVVAVPLAAGASAYGAAALGGAVEGVRDFRVDNRRKPER